MTYSNYLENIGLLDPFRGKVPPGDTFGTSPSPSPGALPDAHPDSLHHVSHLQRLPSEA